MPITVNIGQAKTRLSELVAKVQAGEEITIARQRSPLSALDDRAHRRAVIEAMLPERDDSARKNDTLEETAAWRHEDRRC